MPAQLRFKGTAAGALAAVNALSSTDATQQFQIALIQTYVNAHIVGVLANTNVSVEIDANCNTRDSRLVCKLQVVDLVETPKQLAGTNDNNSIGRL